ncbi:MAG: hypothetical protein K0S93_2459 [Nitrososphaeraceae archaeon]|nr:hypothetical protein [Nitrososphaeraceae archaeon]
MSIFLITILSYTTIITIYAVNEPIKGLSLDNYKFMYSVKFVCIPFVGPDKEEVFVPQNYSTVVNVHLSLHKVKTKKEDQFPTL